MLDRPASTAIVLEDTKKHEGISLWPRPTRNPRDPLRWPQRTKIAITVVVSLVNFTANFAAGGLSVAIPILSQEFQRTPSQVTALLTFNFLFLGVGNAIWVPVASKLGKRCSFLVSTTGFLAALVWAPYASNYEQLLASRCLSGMFASAGESLVPEVINDMFFLHERARMMTIYAISLSISSSLGPLLSGFIVSYTTEGWRNFAWLSVALAAFNLTSIYLFYPESTFHRPVPEAESPTTTIPGHEVKIESESTDVRPGTVADHELDIVQVSWPSVWKTFYQYDDSVTTVQAILNPLVFMIYPSIIWVILVSAVALACPLILGFSLPILLSGPPYFFQPFSVGLIQIAAIIAIIVACIAGYLSDRATAALIRRRKGRYFPEQRLVSLLQTAWIEPLSCIMTGLVCEYKVSWVAIAVALALMFLGCQSLINVLYAYAVESHPDFASDCLVAVNIFKNVVAFVFVYVATDWIERSGWIQVFMIMFMTLTIVTLLAIPLYFYGPALRLRSERIYRPKRKVQHTGAQAEHE
ncbi:hypothetical protein CAC42_6849 [Sphaceloma murrayae]|uniref:Major facilitator superfamily (MFS) profile domain-containing protein n=1 Tax=Sphaceloma murrayae TaxID=2082308 RepID=A0A2K1QGP5_9PEZI|nr:hypothetical protein CAC42_6849 [Sphaceloma murrayae]